MPSMSKELECPVCYNMFNNPCMFRCGHSFCRDCIDTMLESKRECAICRQEIPENSGFSPNIILRKLVDEYETTLQRDSITERTSDVLNILSRFGDNESDGEKYCNITLRCDDVHERDPVHVSGIADVSGSTGSDAELADVAEKLGFSVLDLIKHTLVTSVNSLTDRDFFSLVTFSSAACIIFEKLRMDADGKRLAEEHIKKLQPTGCTNMYDGLKLGKTVLDNDTTSGCRKAMFMFTDGKPYSGGHYYPQNTVTASNDLRGLTDLDGPRDSIPIMAYGFGNEINFELLQNIAKKSGGRSYYISDVSMMATVFLNSFSLFLSTAVSGVRVIIESPDIKWDDDTLYMWRSDFGRQLGVVSRGHRRLICDIPSISFGQEHSIIVPYNAGCDVEDKVYVTARTISGSFRKTAKLDSSNRGDVIETLGFSPNVADNRLRYTFVSTLSKGNQFMKQRAPTQAKQLITNLIRDWELLGGHMGDDHSTSLLREDLSGQVYEAFNITPKGDEEDWYSKWGKNFIPSILNSHLYMTYDDFKNPGLEHYNTGKLFGDTLKKMNEIFNTLTPPEPSNVHRQVFNSSPSFGGTGGGYTTSSRLDSMDTFNRTNSVCYDGDCYVTMADGSKKKVKRLSKNDKVKVPNGSASIVAIVKSPIGKKMNLMTFDNGLIITKWHPIKIKGKWMFPADSPDGINVTIFTEAIYSFILDSGHTLCVGGEEGDGIETVTLGHGFDGMLTHPYFGTDLVIKDVTSKMNDEGIVTCGGVFTNEKSGMVEGLEMV